MQNAHLNHRYRSKYHPAFLAQISPQTGSKNGVPIRSSAQFTFDRTGKTTTNMGWETKGWSFVATSTSTVLSFESVGSYPSNAGPALDNVRVSTIVIAGPDLSLASASSNWSFDGFQLAPWRTAIEDPSNFGPAGTVQIEIVTLNLSSITPATLANVDVFVSPWWAASESAPFHSTIQSFFLSGGHLFLLQDSPGRDGIGALLGIPSTSSTGSVSNGGAPLFDGPFGTAVNITQHGSVVQVTDVLSNNGTVAGTNVQGQVTAAIWNPGDYVAGAGSMVILGDVDMISSSFGGAQFNPPNDKGRFALNTTAFLASAGSTTNLPPTADAGPDQEVVVDETAQLDGNGSSDPDGGSLTYNWQFLNKPFGSSAFLLNPSAVNPTFVPDVPGDYVVQLIVNDGTVDSDPDQVTIAGKECVVPPSGLVSLWKGEGNADDSGGNNNGILEGGATFAPGKVGQAFTLDGVDDYVRIPASTGLPSGSSARTVLMWVFTRASSWADNQNTVFHSGGTSLRRAFSLDMRPHPNMEFYTWADDIVFNAGVPLEGWVHVALVYDGAVGIQAYTQGVLRGSKTLGGVLNTSFVDVQIGALVQLNSYFDGLIDEVAIFNRALTLAEIQANFDAGVAGFCPNQPPLADAGPDQTGDDAVECISPTGTSVTLDGSGSSDPDNGPSPLSYNWTGPFSEGGGSATGVSPTITLPLGTHTIDLIVSDGIATATDSVEVTIEDTTDPVVTMIGDTLKVECGGTYTDPGATANDACDGDLAVTTLDSVDTSTPGTYNITYTATDAAGNTGSATRIVVVVDTTTPVLVGVPDDATVECDAVPDPAEVTATDNCDPEPVVELAEVVTAGTSPDNYTLTRTWTATERRENAASSTQTLTVQDTTPPVLSEVLADATVECDAVPGPASVTATDNCDPDPVVTLVEVRTDGSSPDNYTLSRTWTATDRSGNDATASQTLTVQDTTDPVLSGVPADATVECDAVPGPASVTATDNCDPDPVVTLVEVRTDGSSPDNYTLSRTWTATDRSGNDATASQTLTVQDTTDPVLSGVPADVTVECDAVPGPATVTATDNCDPDPVVALVEVRTDGPSQDNYTLTRTWTATDRSGNAASSSQTLTVQDTTPPVPDLASLPDATGECSATIGAAPTASDNCSGAITGTTTDALTRTTQGTSIVTWTYDDGNGNTTTQTQNIVVNDVTAPVSDAVPLPDATGECSATIPGPPTATDNCAGTVTGTTTDPLTRATQGTSVVTWTYDDGNGNTTTQTQSIVVEDITSPVLTVPADVVVECAGPGGQAVSIGVATAIDNCDPSPTVTNDAPATFSLGTTEVTWTAEDATGNTATAIQSVTVEDTTPPEIEAVLMRVGGSGGDDDDDDGGGGNLFMVSVLGSDVCDPNPLETACIVQPLGPTDQFQLKFKKKKGGGDDDDDDGGGAVKNEIQIKIGKKKTKVTLKGPDQQFLEDLLNAAILKGGFPVIDGQKVKLVVKGGGDDDDDDGGNGGGTWKFVFDANGNLICASGPGLNLLAFATDASGNVSDILNVPVPKKGKGKHAKLAKIRAGRKEGLGGSLDPLSGSPDVRFALDSNEPLTFRLDQNFPNPFNPETTIRYSVREASDVRLIIYNIQGQEVRVLINAPHSAGRYNTRWDGRDASGRSVSTGVYVYRIEAGSHVALRKMVFVK